jgi:hypothetical protein
MPRKTKPDASEKRKTTTSAGAEHEPRVIGPPDAEAIWSRIRRAGIASGDMDQRLAGRPGYALAKRHTATRDPNSRYHRYPRPGHLVVWAEAMGVSATDALRLFGYDVSNIAPQAPIVGYLDDTGAVTQPAPAGDHANLPYPLPRAIAARALAPVPTLGICANAVVVWQSLDDVARYVSGRLCMVRRTDRDARRLAWVVDAPGPGAPCVYRHNDGTLHRAHLYACEPVHHVAHHGSAPTM